MDEERTIARIKAGVFTRNEQLAYQIGVQEQKARDEYLRKTAEEYLASREQYAKHLRQQWLEHSIEILRKLTEKHIVEQYKQAISDVDSER